MLKHNLPKKTRRFQYQFFSTNTSSPFPVDVSKILIVMTACERPLISKFTAELLYPTKNEATMTIYDDCSSRYFGPAFFKHCSDRVIRMPFRHGVNAIHYRAIRDFWNSTYDYLYLTENDCIHDPNWLNQVLRYYNKYRCPVCLYNTRWHAKHYAEIKKDKTCYFSEKTSGVSLFLDRQYLWRWVDQYHATDFVDSYSRRNWDHAVSDKIGRICVTKTSYVEHYGPNGVHTNLGHLPYCDPQLLALRKKNKDANLANHVYPTRTIFVGFNNWFVARNTTPFLKDRRNFLHLGGAKCFL